MSSDNDYFQEAIALTSDADLVVARTAAVLYREMARSFEADGLVPADGFNIHYFFDSVSRLVHSLYLNRELEIRAHPLAGNPILIVCEPDSSSISSVFQKRYLELLRTESAASGQAYDASYALSVAEGALTEEGLKYVLDPAQLDDPQFAIGDTKPHGWHFDDDWLSGFNS